MTSVNSDNNLENLVPCLRESCPFMNPCARVKTMERRTAHPQPAHYTSPIVATLLRLDDFVTPGTHKSQ